MGHKDIISKTIIKRITFDLATIFLKLDIEEQLELLETEQQRIEDRRADVVARVRTKATGQSYLLHIEIQNNHHAHMPIRMLRYYTDIALYWPNEPIRQYLIYIGKQPLRMPEGIDERNLQYHYPIFDIRHLDCQQLLQQDNPDALVLAILCDFKERPAQEIIHYILQRLKTLLADDEKGLRRYIGMLEILSDNRDLKESIKEAEKMLSDIDVTRLPSYELGKESGIEHGIKQGREQGIEQGDQQRQLMIARNMLGKLSDQEIMEFTGLSVKALNELKARQRLDS